MKKIFFVILPLILEFSCSNRTFDRIYISYPIKTDSSYIRIVGLYKNYGKIIYTNAHKTELEKDYIKDGKRIFKPSFKQLIDAETIMMYKSAKYKRYDTIDVVKDYYSYYRQYLGFVNNNGDSIIAINLINPKVFNKMYIGNNFFIIFDERDAIVNLKSVFKRKTLTNTLFVNINKKNIE